ncbi:MAG: histidine kinase [Anaerolineae bacterium]|nr:histidine kinase [Anaerolineae bacterium]
MARPRRDAQPLSGERPAPWAHLRSLRVQILLWTILPIAVFLLGLSFVDVYGHQRAMRVMVEERDRALIEAVAGRIADNLEYYATLLQAVGCREALRQGTPETQAKVLASLAGQFPAGIALLDAAGELRVADGPADSWVRSSDAGGLAREALQEGEPAYLASPGAGLPPHHLAVAAPLLTGDGVLVGVLPLSRSAIVEAVDSLHTVHLPQAATTPSATHTGGPGGQAWLLDGRGQLIHGVGAPAASALWAEGLPAQREEVVTTAVTVPGTDWQLVYSEPWHHLLPLVLRYAQATALVVVAAVLISLLAVYSVVRYVTAPLQELGRRARRMAWGDFSAVDEPVGGVREIAHLQNALRQAADQVRGYQAAMRHYVAAVTRAQEEERKRLARELHDDTVQSLIVLGQQLERMDKGGFHDTEACRQQLGLVRQGIRDLVHGVRRLIGDLRPSYLDDLGLVPALEMLVKALPAGYQAEFVAAGEERRLPPDLELAVFRIVQEALRNVEQHAQARHVRVHLGFDERGVRVVVEDDGVGFTVPASPDDLARQGHFGLLGMRERAMLFGGWLALTSQPGHGTRVEAHLAAAVHSTAGR